MLCYVGDIVTVDREERVFRYLVEERGRIVFVGDSLPSRYRGAEMVPLNGRALIPSFVDTHQHFASFSTFHAGLNVMEAESNAQILEMLREFALKERRRTLIAFGASPHSVKEHRLVERGELDRACPDREVMVVKYDGHACVVNTKLLQKIGKRVRDLRGYHPDTGEMNQEAFFEASNYITNSVSIPELFRNMQAAVDFQAARGIGCIHTVSGVGFKGDLDITFEKIFAKSLKNGFQMRVFPQSLSIKAATRRKLPRIGGCFQCALDGCFGSHDAALEEPYADEAGGTGVLYYSDETVIDFCKKANRAGLQIELHAIGDRAFAQACRALRAALVDYPREDHRHGIIHGCLPTPEGMAICGDYGIQLPVQSAFIRWRQEPDEYLESIMGRERAGRLNPLRTLTDRGIMLSAGSDAPCTSPDPIVWMDREVNHSNEKEALTIRQALRMCTYNGYYAGFDEGERGSLEAGKVADMVILSENPYEVPRERVKELRVERLILDGRPYESCREPVVKAMFAGLFSGRKA